MKNVNNHSQSITARSAGFTGILAILLLAGCGPEKGDTGHEVNANLTVPVEVAPVRTGALTVTRTYSATLEGQEQAVIVPKISERVAKVHVDVGTAVSERQVLVTLDKSGASSQFYQAEANYRNAEKNLERMKSLYAEGAISLQALDGTQTAFDVAKANFVAARSIVELTTPIAGVVTAVNINTGDLASPGMALATVARIGRMKAIFNMNETDVASLAIGQRVTISSEARPDLHLQGNLLQISHSADVRSRSFEVKAVFPNTPDRWFRPGMFAKVSVQISSGGGVMTVPNLAIQTDGVTSRIFVVKDGRAYQRNVETGMTDGERTVILSGLSPADSVATTGINNVRDSTAVTVTRVADAH